MAEIAMLDLQVGSVTPNQVEIVIKNIGETLSDPLMIEYKFDLGLVTTAVGKAVEEARQQNLIAQTTTSRVSLAGVVSGPAGWSVWAMAESTETFAVIRVLNHVDQSGEKLASPVKFEKDAQTKVVVPLTPPPKPAHVEIPYSYRYPNVGREGKQTDGKLQLTTSGAGEAPKVTFAVDHKTPTTIPAGDPVRIEWKIENGVSATLFGPLPGGTTQMSLSSDDTATYKISNGALKIIAVGAATYILHAEVRGESNKPNQLVIKTVQIDIASVKQYAHIQVRPSIVLPHGMIEVTWAVWDTKQAWLRVGKDQIELQLTEQGPSQKFQGSGIWRVNAPKVEGDVSAWLEILHEEQRREWAKTGFRVETWDDAKPNFNGNPIGMALMAPKLALLTTDGLWLATVGHTDPYHEPKFDRMRIDTALKSWRGIAAFDKGFVALQQTNDDGLQLARYTVDGKPDGLPVVLGDNVQSLVKTGMFTCDLAVLSDRVYVVVEASLVGGPIRFAASVTFKPQAQLRSEPLLEKFPRYRMFAFDNALYTINRANGRMFRMRHNTSGQLDQPAKAASAVKDGQSMIRQGLIFPVGRVLLVLGPSSIPSVEELEGFAPLKYLIPARMLKSEPIEQDLVYNPQQDQWIPCGHGLDIDPASFAAFRPGASKRLWVVNPDHTLSTLSGANEHLFAPAFEQDYSPKTLLPYLDKNKKRKVTIRNETGRRWRAMIEPYLGAGFEDFSSAGPAEVSFMPEQIDNTKQWNFEFTCNETDPVPMTLRFLTESPYGVAHDYMVEITLSGPGLCGITSVFKRLDRHSGVSVAEIRGTREHHPGNAVITVKAPESLTKGIKLIVTNNTPYELVQQTTGRNDRPKTISNRAPVPINIDWNTPVFRLSADGAGELPFDVDFGLVPGVELSSRREKQKHCLRIVNDQGTGLHVLSASFKEPNVYECVIQYRRQKELPNSICVAGGKGSKDGKGLYLAMGAAVNPTQAYVARIDPDSLEITATSEVFTGQNIFSAPWGAGVLSEHVVAMFGDRNLHVMNHSLQKILDSPVIDSTEDVKEFTALPYMETYNDDRKIHFTTMKQIGSGPSAKYSYKHLEKILIKYRNDQPETLEYGWSDSMDSFVGFVATNRVAGAPRWVSPSTISPSAPQTHTGTWALCIEGGFVHIQPRPSLKIQEVRIEGAGREEAVLFDTNTALLYCAHSSPNSDGLVITRINTNNFQDKKSLTLPGAVVNMATDTRPFKTPALQYQQYRAVSLAAPGYDVLFVAHGNKIYQLNKNDLTVIKIETVELPCRFVQVRWGQPQGGGGRNSGQDYCWVVWAVGATYKGDGTKVDQYKSQLYKLAFLRAE